MSTVVRLAARGDGVTDDGRYFAGVAPGDEVDAAGAVTPGPHHAVPPCRHFPNCGGCQLQHVDDASLALFTVDRIAYALRSAGVAIGGIEPTHLSPPRTRRRASLRALRRGRKLVLGFNTERSHQVVDIHECHVLLRELFALVAPLRALLGGLVGDGQAAGVMLTASDSGIDVLLTNIDARPLAAAEALASFAAAHDLARLSVESTAGIETIAEARLPIVRFGGMPVGLPPAPFLQATRDGEAALQAAVAAATIGAPRVAALFCGLGTFARPASATAKVLAADAAGPAVAALQAAARLVGRPLATSHRDLFRKPLTAAELNAFDAVILDPPRVGAVDQVAALAVSAVPRIAYVSCNPNSFARDAAMLQKGGYRLERLWPVGQFRWSTHVELVAAFART